MRWDGDAHLVSLSFSLACICFWVMKKCVHDHLILWGTLIENYRRRVQSAHLHCEAINPFCSRFVWITRTKIFTSMKYVILLKFCKVRNYQRGEMLKYYYYFKGLVKTNKFNLLNLYRGWYLSWFSSGVFSFHYIYPSAMVT